MTSEVSPTTTSQSRAVFQNTDFPWQVMLVNQKYFHSSKPTADYIRIFYKAVLVGKKALQFNKCEYEIHVFSVFFLSVVLYIMYYHVFLLVSLKWFELKCDFFFLIVKDTSLLKGYHPTMLWPFTQWFSGVWSVGL